MAENSVKELKDFFSTEDKPVSAKEMMEFWAVLTPEEKVYFMTADLS